MTDVGFIHLHVHSAYSLREGALPIATLAKLAKADNQPALAITDNNNLFGALEFSEKMADEGIQPIIGMELRVDMSGLSAREEKATIAEKSAHKGAKSAAIGAQKDIATLVLLVTNETGYQNLMAMASSAYLDKGLQEVEPHIAFADLRPEGLIALTGGPKGPLDLALQEGRSERAHDYLAALKAKFGDRLYVELQRHELDSERQIEGGLIALADALDVPLVATNEPYFATIEDYEAQDVLLCIADGTTIGTPNRRQLSPNHYFRTRAEMMALFADLPEALEASVIIAQRCHYRPLKRKPILPRFTSVENKPVDEVEALVQAARAGLAARLSQHPPAPGYSITDYEDRLAFELGVIQQMGFPGYFLIVADFISWAKAHNIPVGPGRGSGAGSLVAYALTITDLDPMRFGLLFERFLNPERISMPDFDIDFCQERRDEVIAYVRERYGHDRVAQIITFGSFLARGVLRNVARALEMPLGQADRLAKLVPHNPAKPISLAQALIEEPRLREAAEQDPRVAKLLAIAQTLEGLYSNAATHAAGVVIGDRPLSELVPLYQDPRAPMPATQFNMKWVEAAGLVKFDFLGLKTLTVLQRTVELLAARGIAIDISTLPLDDEKSFAMLRRGEAVGIFQLESAGMRRALVDMKVDRFEDIIALVALYRPGPMANIPTYCARKLGREQPEYIHPKLKEVLAETYGVIIYQEQVMQIAQILSGYSLGEADLLRRAMGKKIKAEMDAQRTRFVVGALKHDVPEKQAQEIFDLLARFADYGFNKSHAAAYALIAYQTAWFKANYPVAFLAASMSFDKANTDKLADFRAEAERLDITMIAPCVNRSGVDFELYAMPDGKLAITYALSALKGAGEGAARALVAVRGQKPFKDLSDFASRIDPRLITKRMMECLAGSGAFDCLEPDRAKVFAASETILAFAQRKQAERAAGQNSLFLGADNETLALPTKVAPWTQAERLAKEFENIGFFLSGHPLDAYAAMFSRLRVQRFADFEKAVRRGALTGKLAASLVDRSEKRTKTGGKLGILTLSDASGQYEAVMYQELLQQYRPLLEKGALLLINLQASVEGEDLRIRVTAVERLDEALARIKKGLRIALSPKADLAVLKQNLNKPGDSAIAFHVALEEPACAVEIALPGHYAISPALAEQISALPGVLRVEHF